MRLRILHVATLVSPDGEYGGPTRVALNQAAALQERGHDVTVAAGSRGFAEPPSVVNGVALKLFPVRTVVPGVGFAGLGAPKLLAWLRRQIHNYDLVHVHAARDLVTMPVAALARRRKIPYVLQTHGMIDHSSNPLAGPFDALFTRPVLSHAQRIFFLTATESEHLTSVAKGHLRTRQLSNGVPHADPGQAPRSPAEVLYLARLAPRKRPATFVEAAATLCTRRSDTSFALVGPDEGEAATVDEAISASGYAARIVREPALAPERTLARMAEASVYVLPSVDEPYPMSVLEAMSLGIPVIVTRSCGLAGFVRRTDAGFVVDDSVDDLVAAIDRLLGDDSLRHEFGQNGLRAVRAEHGMDAIAAQLEDVYGEAIGV